MVSPALFQVLHLEPAVGRLLDDRDAAPNSVPAVVLGHDYWRRIGAPADIVGQSLLLDEVARTIVAVAPPALRIELVNHPADVFVPLTPVNFGAGNRGLRGFRVIARLADAVSQQEASTAAAIAVMTMA